MDSPAPPPNLFIPLDLPGWVDPAAASDDSIICSEPVQIDFSVLDALNPDTVDLIPSDPIQFNLLDGVSVPAIFTHAEPRWSTEVPEDPWTLLDAPILPIGYTWDGTILGDPDAYVIMITGPGYCEANIHVPDAGWFHVRRAGEGTHVVRMIERGLPVGCDASAADHIPWPPSQQGQRQISGGPNGDDGSKIDVLVVYTPLARQAAVPPNGDPNDHSFIQNAISMALEDAKKAHKNSLVGTTFRLLCTSEVDYDEDPATGTMCQHLDAIKNPWDGLMDDVHALRDSLRADLVILVVVGAPVPCSPGGPIQGGLGGVMAVESAGFESEAFSVVKRTYLTNQVLAHETGHNMGCAHDRGFYDPGCTGECTCEPGAFAFSFGYRFPSSSPLYRTIMAYPPGQQIDHFSNPFVSYPPTHGMPTGVSQLACGGAADNAATMNLTKDTVARFRNSIGTTNTTIMASTDTSAMVQGNGSSGSVSLSNNGQYVVFASAATNFATSDLNGTTDVFAFNREAGIGKLVSEDTGHPPAPGNGASSAPSISGDGRFISFASGATNLLPPPGDSNSLTDIFVYDQLDTSIRRLNLTSDELPAWGGHSSRSSISLDGRRVVFESEATNLIGAGEDTNVMQDIFVRYRDGNGNGLYDESGDSSTDRVSVADQTGAQAEGGPSLAPSISADGLAVAFESDAPNLVVGDTHGHRDVFVRELASLLVERVSVGGINTQANGPSFAPSISSDGTIIVFESDATNLVTGNDPSGYRDIFLRDRGAVETIRITMGFDGSDANGHSYAPEISDDDKYVVFYSGASNLLPNSPGNEDTNGVADIFLYERETGVISRVSVNSSGVEATGGGSLDPVVSLDGRFIAFESDATNLANDQGGFRDVFLRDRGVMCPADITGDGQVNAADLAILLGSYGLCADCASCRADLNHDGTVDAQDLALLLGAWGPC